MATSTLRTGGGAVHWTTTVWGADPRPQAQAASLWIVAGVDIKTVSSWLGHSTAKLTLDTYGHLMGTAADRAALAPVNRALGMTAPERSEALDEEGW